jgi:GNAT superfamily N-acetyltransferase
VLDPTPAASAAPEQGLRVVLTRYDSPLAQELVEEVQAEYVQRYGGRDDSPVDPEEFTPPDGAFLVVTAGGTSVGTVALRRHVPDVDVEEAAPADEGPVAELKRLYVRAGHRRRGHARRILRLAEEQARALGYRRIVLETGTEQPEAMALYAAEGYTPAPAFGHYRCAPRSRAFAKDL